MSSYLICYRKWSTKDKTSLYMLFDYVCGGELFSYLRTAGRFAPSTGKHTLIHLILCVPTCVFHICVERYVNNDVNMPRVGTQK